MIILCSVHKPPACVRVIGGRADEGVPDPQLPEGRPQRDGQELPAARPAAPRFVQNSLELTS